MTEEDDEAFAEAILRRVAELAYAELKPSLERYARQRQAGRTTAPRSATTATPPGVVSVDARRARRAA